MGDPFHLGELTDKNRRAFEPPADGDWMLLLDDATKKYPASGSRP
jgi:hypothetical protein